MNKEIWLDCDGVLLDYTRAFLKFCNLDIPYEKITEYSLAKLFGHATRSYEEDGYDGSLITRIIYPEQLMREHMTAFHNSEEFTRLESLVSPDSLILLKMMGYTIHCITQLEPGECRKSRLINLERNFPALIDDVTFTVYPECKLETIRKIRPEGTIIIVEDNPKLLKTASDTVKKDIDSGKMASVLAYGIIHPYNATALSRLQFIAPQLSLTAVVNHIMAMERSRVQ